MNDKMFQIQDQMFLLIFYTIHFYFIPYGLIIYILSWSLLHIFNVRCYFRKTVTHLTPECLSIN